MSTSRNLEYNTILANIDRLPGTGPVIFNGIGRGNENEDYFRRGPGGKREAQAARTRALVPVEWSALTETTPWYEVVPWVYIPCGISSGLRPHELAAAINEERRRQGRSDFIRSTYKIDEYIGAQRHGDEVIEPNRRDNMIRARMAQALMPEAVIIAPVLREGAVRQFSQNYAFNRGQGYEEEGYMALWYPVIDRCRYMILDGDWNYSRNSIWEVMRGLTIQMGLVTTRPKADMDVFALDKRPITMLERAEKIAKSLKYQIGKGFEPREAATALAQMFVFDQWLRTGYRPDKASPNVHPILSGRQPAELKAMESLRTSFEPLIKWNLAGFLRPDDLPDDWQAAIAAAKSKPLIVPDNLQSKYRIFSRDISARANDIFSIAPSEATRIKAAPAPHIQQRLYDAADGYFGPAQRATFFEDNFYDNLSEWEQLALAFAIGGTETALAPAKHPFATLVLTDLKRSGRGFSAAQDLGIHNLDELAGALGRQKINRVIEENWKDIEALCTSLKRIQPGRATVSTVNLLRIVNSIENGRKAHDTYSHLSNFVAAPGGNKTSSLLRTLLSLKYLDRNVDDAIFSEGWERSKDLVQLRVRARLIQAALVPRPMGDQVGVQIHTYRKTPHNTLAVHEEPDTLLNDIRLLTEEQKRLAATGTSGAEQSLALIRLIALGDMIADSRLSGSLINPLKIDIALGANSISEMQRVKAEALPLLLTHGVRDIPYERLFQQPCADETPAQQTGRAIQNRLMDVYVKAQRGLAADQLREKQARPKQGVLISHGGPTK